MTVESPLRRKAHGGFGERPGETDRQQRQYRAPGRLSVTVFADHGAGGSGEPLAIMLRPGNAGSNTAADHVEATRLALAQLPAHLRRRVLIRSDSGGGTHEFLAWLTQPGRRLAYSRDHPAPRPCTRLTSSNQPNDQKGHPRAVEPRPPGATAGPPH